jgi:hypothetical protein
MYLLCEISSSHGSEYGARNLLWCTAMFLIECRHSVKNMTVHPRRFWASMYLVSYVCSTIINTNKGVVPLTTGPSQLLPSNLVLVLQYGPGPSSDFLEVSGSNLSPETSYPDWDFLLFFSFLKAVVKIGHGHFLPCSFQIHIQYHPTIQHYMVWAIEDIFK